MLKRESLAVVAAAALLAVAGCGAEEKPGAKGGGTADAAAERAPSKKLVKWVGGMCESAAVLKAAQKQSADDLKEIRKPSQPGLSAQGLAIGYVGRASLPVDQALKDVGDLERSGVPAADRLREAWLKKLKRAASGLDEITPGDALDDPEGKAADVDGLVQSAAPPEPGIKGLKKKEPRLAAAHERAKQCAPGWKPDADEADRPAPEPTGPLPDAQDGKDAGACSDGECEIRVTSPVDVTANGVSMHVTADDGSVTFQSDGGYMRLGGQGGVAKFGDDLKVTVVAQNKNGAVLKFAKP